MREHTSDSTRAGPPEDPVSLARSLRSHGQVFLLLRACPSRSSDGEAAVELADALGRSGRPPLVLDLAQSSPVLRSDTPGQASRGLADVLRGEATFVEVTIREHDHFFMYVPLGRRNRHPARMLEELVSTGMLERAANRGVQVLLIMNERDARELSEPNCLDGTVLVGDASAPASGVPAGRVPVVGRLSSPRLLYETHEKSNRRAPWLGDSDRPKPPTSNPISATPPELLFASGSSSFREESPNWWFVLAICLLSAALGLSVLSALSEDSWFRDFYLERPPSTSTESP